MGVWEKKGRKWERKKPGDSERGKEEGGKHRGRSGELLTCNSHPSPGVARTVAIRGSCHCPLKALFTF